MPVLHAVDATHSWAGLLGLDTLYNWSLYSDTLLGLDTRWG